jgi:hypothetical protein
MQEDRKQFYHLAIGSFLLLAVFFLVATVLFVPTQAIDVDVSVSNTAPTFVSDPIFSTTQFGDELYAQDEVYNLRFGEDSLVYVHGMIQDQNGQSDIDYVNAYLYRSDLDNTCVEDGNKCYYVLGCTLSNNANQLRINYICPFSLKYWMDATDTMAGGSYGDYSWQLEVVAVDDYALSATNTGRVLEVYSSVALDIPSAIDFGSMNIGEFTTYQENVEQVLTQQGNVEQNVTVVSPSGEFPCESGEIPIENLKWSLREIGWDHNETTSLTTMIADTDIRVAKQTDETTAPTKILYWNLNVPSGVGGSCTATINILAKNAFFN